MNDNKSLRLVNNETVKSSSANTYVEALANSRPMHELSIAERTNAIMASILNAIFIGGWAQKADIDIVVMTNFLLSEINSRFKFLTEAEVKAAFAAGAKGNYGQAFGVSVASCLGWLNSYQIDAKRIEAKKELEAKKAIQDDSEKHSQVALTSQQKNETVQAAFSKFLKQGTYHDYGNFVYDLLDKMGMIPYTASEKRAFVEKGRVAVYNQLQNWRDLQEKRENEKKLSELMDSDTTAIMEAKRLALIDYFEKLKAAGIEILHFPAAA